MSPMPVGSAPQAKTVRLGLLLSFDAVEVGNVPLQELSMAYDAIVERYMDFEAEVGVGTRRQTRSPSGNGHRSGALQ